MTTLLSLLCLTALGANTAGPPTHSVFVNKEAQRWATPIEIKQPSQARAFQHSQSITENHVEFGIGDDALWFEIPYDSTNSHGRQWLEVRNPHLDYLDLFLETIDGQIKPLSRHQGDDHPFIKRDITLRHFVFELPAASDRISTIWLRVQSTTARSVPIYLSSTNELFRYLQWRTLIDGIFLGLVLVLGIYSLLALSGPRRSLVGSYILFLLGIVLFHVSLWGYGYQWLWSAWPTLQKISPIAAMALTAIGLNIYVARFIGIDRRSQLGLGVLAINFVWGVLTIGSANLDMLAISMSATAASIVSSVILGAMVLYHVLSRRNAAIFISIAFGPFVVSAIAYSLQKLGVIEFGPWVESILPISTTFQATVLAYGIQLTHQKTRASQKEMSQSNLQLQDQLTLESLSRLDLVGNVIHELNNPLNFVSASSAALSEHDRKLKKFRDSLFPSPPEDPDASYMYEILTELIEDHAQSAQDLVEGAKRADEILNQMRELAELSPQVKREIDVCSLLEPVLSAVNGSGAHFRSLLSVDYSDINQEIPPTLKTSPFILVHSLVRLSRVLIESAPDGERDVLIKPSLRGLTIVLAFKCPGFSGSKAELLADVESDDATQVIRRWFQEQKIKWHLEVLSEGDLIWTLEFPLVGNSPTLPVLSLPSS